MIYNYVMTKKMGRPKMSRQEVKGKSILLRLTHAQNADLRRRAAPKPIATFVRAVLFPETSPSK